MRLTEDEKRQIWKIWGPDGRVGPNIRQALLNPYARMNPDQHQAIIKALNAIESLFEDCLKRMPLNDPTSICLFIEACCSARAIINELRKYAA